MMCALMQAVYALGGCIAVVAMAYSMMVVAVVVAGLFGGEL